MSAEARQVGGDHYQKLGIQPMKFAMVNDWDAGAFSILKHLSRHRRKDGKKDIEKAIHFVELRIEQVLFHNRSVVPIFDRITMREYVNLNNFQGDTRLALLILEQWVYDGRRDILEALIRVLNRILSAYS